MGIDIEKHKKFPWIEWHEFGCTYRCTECGSEYPMEDWPKFDSGIPNFPSATSKFVTEHKHCSLEDCLKNLFDTEVNDCPFCELENGVHRTDCVWLIAKNTFKKKSP
jgi:hypothetical protein